MQGRQTYTVTFSNRYTRGGLIEQAFYIQIANALLPELIELLSPYTFLLSRILVRSALVVAAAAVDHP